jgi:hypothetical protein
MDMHPDAELAAAQAPAPYLQWSLRVGPPHAVAPVMARGLDQNLKRGAAHAEPGFPQLLRCSTEHGRDAEESVKFFTSPRL